MFYFNLINRSLLSFELPSRVRLFHSPEKVSLVFALPLQQKRMFFCCLRFDGRHRNMSNKKLSGDSSKIDH